MHFQYYYDYILDQFDIFKNRSQHHLTWIHSSTLMHENLNDCQYADQPLHQLLTSLFKADHHNDTLIMLYSDHSIRIGPILETNSGYYETRLPFLYIRVPDSLQLRDQFGMYK